LTRSKRPRASRLVPRHAPDGRYAASDNRLAFEERRRPEVEASGLGHLVEGVVHGLGEGQVRSDLEALASSGVPHGHRNAATAPSGGYSKLHIRSFMRGR
jgi:hypothetical protein